MASPTLTPATGTSGVAGTEGVGALALPPRQAVERRLISNGLYGAIDQLSRWENFALRFLSVRAFVAWALLVAIWLVVWSIVQSATSTATPRLFEFLGFDVLTGMVAVLAVLVAGGLNRRDGRAVARRFALAASGVVLAIVLMPHLLFSVLELDTRVSSPLRLAEGAASLPPHRQPLLPHVGVAVIVFVLLAAEIRTSVAENLWAMSKSVARATPRTVLDVLRTLPVVLVVVFLVAFGQDVWRVIGELQFARLAVLIIVLALCLVVSVVSLAIDEANRALDGAEVMGLSGGKNVPIKDTQLAALVAVGLQPCLITRRPRIRRAVVLQWALHISLRVAGAAAAVGLLALAVTALTMTEPLLRDWLKQEPHQVLAVSPFGIDIYVTGEAFAVSALLGAFAAVVFVAAALSEDEARDRLLGPERQRMRLLLTLAGTYQSGVEQGVWHGRPGQRWKSYGHFLAEDPDRRRLKPVALGKQWRETTDGGRARARWRAAWNPGTKELYVFRWRPPGPVEILGLCGDHDELDSRLEGWQAKEHGDDSLAWLRERAHQR